MRAGIQRNMPGQTGMRLGVRSWDSIIPSKNSTSPLHDSGVTMPDSNKENKEGQTPIKSAHPARVPSAGREAAGQVGGKNE